MCGKNWRRENQTGKLVAWLCGKARTRARGAASRTQADLELSRTWRLVRCLLSVLALCRGEGATPKQEYVRQQRGAGMSLVSSSYSPFSFSLLPLTSPYISLPHSSLVSLPGTSESSQHPTTLSKVLIIKPTCPATLCPHSGHPDLSP